MAGLSVLVTEMEPKLYSAHSGTLMVPVVDFLHKRNIDKIVSILQCHTCVLFSSYKYQLLFLEKNKECSWWHTLVIWVSWIASSNPA